MRLDKYLSGSGMFSRSEAGRAIRSGRITVNGEVVKSPSVHIDENTASVKYGDEAVVWTKYKYAMLNKPEGYISATDTDPSDTGRTVMSLLPPEFTRLGMFPCGRLDIDTVGLLLITDNGPLAHELLSPKHHVEKTYRFRCSVPVGDEMHERLESGIEFSDFTSKPCRVVLDPDGLSGEISVTEGKFHQVKRMFHAVGSEIVFLERIRFGPLELDNSLPRGEWRWLTEAEIAALNSL
ncbi:MAG: rRNA pseudouridine synthase [Ruminococcaceae bacterium]|nr:rRNA pseudouridine synthase [Oscillospiraceae bacterium]